ncbi:hypothetical protein GGP41_001895 [Bipolaris sorokiniana]|uniref:Uncharacterized protein n=1 Tax=Cochliobolus sativus TaxID=45130 RepID=A0A8H5ZPR0_COCSA|nr:hypothetical protein GGP41_001895 [Bipolaris sorokiniana]
MNAFCVAPSDDLGCQSLGRLGPVRAYNESMDDTNFSKACQRETEVARVMLEEVELVLSNVDDSCIEVAAPITLLKDVLMPSS